MAVGFDVGFDARNGGFDCGGIGACPGEFDEVGMAQEVGKAGDYRRGKARMAAHGGEEFVGGLIGRADAVGAFNVTADDVGDFNVEVFEQAVVGQLFGEQAGEFVERSFGGGHAVFADLALDVRKCVDEERHEEHAAKHVGNPKRDFTWSGRNISRLGVDLVSTGYRFTRRWRWQKNRLSREAVDDLTGRGIKHLHRKWCEAVTLCAGLGRELPAVLASGFLGSLDGLRGEIFHTAKSLPAVLRTQVGKLESRIDGGFGGDGEQQVAVEADGVVGHIERDGIVLTRRKLRRIRRQGIVNTNGEK